MTRDDDSDGPTIPARFRVYPDDPVPQGDRLIAVILLLMALALVVALVVIL